MRRLSTAPITALSLVALLLLASACAPSQEEAREAQAEIEKMLTEYLPKMGAVYRSGALDSLDPYVVPLEKAAVEHRRESLAETGKLLEAELVEVTIEEVSLWGGANAYVRTVETWDLTARARGSDQVLGQELGQVSRVNYQLKKEDGVWRIYRRALLPAAN